MLTKRNNDEKNTEQTSLSKIYQTVYRANKKIAQLEMKLFDLYEDLLGMVESGCKEERISSRAEKNLNAKLEAIEETRKALREIEYNKGKAIYEAKLCEWDKGSFPGINKSDVADLFKAITAPLSVKEFQRIQNFVKREDELPKNIKLTSEALENAHCMFNDPVYDLILSLSNFSYYKQIPDESGGSNPYLIPAKFKQVPYYKETEEYQNAYALRKEIFAYLDEKIPEYTKLYDKWISLGGKAKQENPNREIPHPEEDMSRPTYMAPSEYAEKPQTLEKTILDDTEKRINIYQECKSLEKKIFAYAQLYRDALDIHSDKEKFIGYFPEKKKGFTDRLAESKSLFSEKREQSKLFKNKKSDSQKLFESLTSIVAKISVKTDAKEESKAEPTSLLQVYKEMRVLNETLNMENLALDQLYDDLLQKIDELISENPQEAKSDAEGIIDLICKKIKEKTEQIKSIEEQIDNRFENYTKKLNKDDKEPTSYEFLNFAICILNIPNFAPKEREEMFAKREKAGLYKKGQALKSLIGENGMDSLEKLYTRLDDYLIISKDFASDSRDPAADIKLFSEKIYQLQDNIRHYMRIKLQEYIKLHDKCNDSKYSSSKDIEARDQLEKALTSMCEIYGPLFGEEPVNEQELFKQLVKCEEGLKKHISEIKTSASGKPDSKKLFGPKKTESVDDQQFLEECIALVNAIKSNLNTSVPKKWEL